jgi:hypothetical protein
MRGYFNALFSSFAALVSCTSGPGMTPDASSSAGVPSSEVRAKICAFENIDGSSEIYVALDKNGSPARLVVTPSRRIADHGNRVFDLSGNHLGDMTGGEFPWDDEALMTKERARVAAIMGDAEIPDSATPQRCR